MLRNIYLVAGHNSKGTQIDNGACANGYKEAELTIELRDLVYNELKSKFKGGLFKDDDTKSLGGSTGIFSWLNNLNLDNTNDLVLEFHFNSFDTKSSGVEIVIPDYNLTKIDIRELKIANSIADIIANTLNIQKRKGKLGAGIKTTSETYRGTLAMMKLKGINILVEVCFISNPTEIKNYIIQAPLLSKKISNFLLTE